MKKIIYSIAIIPFILFSFVINAQSYLDPAEGFEHNGNAPDSWTEEYVNGTQSWEYKEGGFYKEGESHPDTAFAGIYNAAFIYSTSYTTKLVSPSLNLSKALKPALIFGHAMQKWGADIDELHIYFKNGLDSTWMLLKDYTLEVPVWIERTIYLPDSLLTGDCYVAFEAVSSFGAGVCIDSVRVIEKGRIPKRINDIKIKGVTTNFIPTNSFANQIMQLNFEVIGNNGDVVLDSIAVKSLNTSDNDIETGGVKLYYTEDTIFNTGNEIGASSFVNDVAVFNNLNQILPYDWSSVWVCYDIGLDLTHKMHNHIADAMIEAEAIKISNSTYPAASKSPDGSRTIYEAIFIDGFEKDNGWTLTGEFERATPQGLGSTGFYKPDPSEAFNGDTIIGTDLSGLGANSGDYEPNLSNREYSATSSSFNARYFKDVSLVFQKMLNLDSQDTAYIELSSNNGTDWEHLWQSNGYYNDRIWVQTNFDVSDIIDYAPNGKIRFAIGGTDATYQAGGWNIDDVVFVGDYVAKDVGVINWVAPVNGCGHTNEEYVEITIKNFAGDTLKDPLAISFSIDGSTIYRDTIATPDIAPDNSITYTISKYPVDLTNPGWYNNAYATTNLPGDEISSNNRLNNKLFIAPTYTLPYNENFENNYGYFTTGGANSTWEYGVPAGTLIDTAYSGTKAWVTNLDGWYLEYESSYLESPCFDFTGNDSIVFEFKCIGESQDQVDGLAVMYSLNQGGTWNLLPNDHDYYWEWYNETSISTLGSAGIDNTGSSWLTMRQLLPNTFSNQASVKFRFVLESDLTITYEGFGIDDIKIYEAPYDVGATSLNYPYTRCEWDDATHVKVYIENYGLTDVISGTKIPLTLNFESEITNDTLTLASNLAPEDSILFTFNTTVDMSYAGDYDFTINTKLESNTFFYNETLSNDTIYATITVQGIPGYNPFNDQIGANPVTTVTLDAEAGYNNYSWTLPPPDLTASSQTWAVQQEGWHYVTVTRNASPSNCTAIDSVEVVSSLTDLVMDSLYTVLKDSCHRNALTELSVHYINKGLNSLAVNDTILLAYQINNNPIVLDSMFLTQAVAVDDTAWFTYNEKANLKTPGYYSIKVFTNILKDLNHADDTVTKTVNTNGYVDVELNYDTVYSSQADTLDIIATSGYSNYSWVPAETNDTINPINNMSQWYKVTVTDGFACGSDKDSVYVETYDFGIQNIVSPVSNCEFTATEAIQISVYNHSGNTYSTGTKIPFEYSFDNASWINDTATLTSNFNPGTDKTLTITNTINPSALGNHSLEIKINALEDADASNDTYNHEFETWGYPDVNLPIDTIYTTKADTVVLIADEGLAIYNWSDGSTNDTLQVSKKYSYNYIVTVADGHGCGTDKDSTQIITYNVGINELIAPISDCEHSSSKQVIVSVKNYSADTLHTGTIIPVGYILEGTSAVNENFILTSKLDPQKTANHTFTSSTVDVSAINTHKFKLYTAFNLDVYSSNDTLVDAIKTFGYPDIDLGEDIYTTEPETVVLTAQAGYNNYIWSDGSNNNTFSVINTASKLYSVTVTDVNGCETIDDVNVYTYNIVADSINSPVAQCELTNSETVIIGVTNTGGDTLQIDEPLEVGYRLDSGSYVSQSFTLTGILYPDSTELFTLSSHPANLSVNQLHEFKIFAKLTTIDVELSDTNTINIDYLKPDFDLGSNVTTGDTQYPIDAGADYSTYAWFDNVSTGQTYIVDINSQTANHYYAVTVTKDGCEASDSIQVIFSTTADLAVTSMTSPGSSVCWQVSTYYPVSIQIRNSGVVNLPSGTSFDVGYRIDNGTPVTETINLSTAMNVNDTRDYTFPTTINFTAPKIYQFKPFVYLAGDGTRSNDTLLTADVNIAGPIVSLGPSDTIYFTTATYEISVEGTTYDSYAWSTGETTKTITISETGTYYVTVTDGGCQGFGKIHCQRPTGIDNIISGDGYSISYYPNPVSENLTIEFDNDIATDAIIEIINTNGQLIYQTKLNKIKNSIEKINVSPYTNGIYYLRFKIKDKFYVRKLVIQ